MFELRGLDVSFSAFAMVYLVLSAAVVLTWRRIYRSMADRPISQIADLLFVLRMFPLIAAALVTAAFTVPSFLLLEPRSINEPVGGLPLVLGICGALLGGCGIANLTLAILRASRTISKWTGESEPANSIHSVPLLRIRRTIPAMAAAGIMRPKILLSSSAEFLLSGRELKAALNHEFMHVRRRDNLRKLLLRFVAFPWMKALEATWLEATEMAADDAAVHSNEEALDLAAALIKLSRLSPANATMDLTTALVHSPAAVMNARIERLIAWTSQDEEMPSNTHWPRWAAVAATLLALGAIYGPALVDMHAATEWLIR